MAQSFKIVAKWTTTMSIDTVTTQLIVQKSYFFVDDSKVVMHSGTRRIFINHTQKKKKTNHRRLHSSYLFIYSHPNLTVTLQTQVCRLQTILTVTLQTQVFNFTEQFYYPIGPLNLFVKSCVFSHSTAWYITFFKCKKVFFVNDLFAYSVSKCKHCIIY